MDESLKDIYQKVEEFRNERDWHKYHDPKNLSQGLGIEAAELQEIFLWKTNDESKKLSMGEFENVKEEIADIGIYLIYLCIEFKIDIFDVIGKKIRINEIKYPIEKCKGRNVKYNKL